MTSVKSLQKTFLLMIGHQPPCIISTPVAVSIFDCIRNRSLMSLNTYTPVSDCFKLLILSVHIIQLVHFMPTLRNKATIFVDQLSKFLKNCVSNNGKRSVRVYLYKGKRFDQIIHRYLIAPLSCTQIVLFLLNLSTALLATRKYTFGPFEIG